MTVDKIANYFLKLSILMFLKSFFISAMLSLFILFFILQFVLREMQLIFNGVKHEDYSLLLQHLRFIKIPVLRSEQNHTAVPGASSFSVGLPVFTQFPPTLPHSRRVSIKGRRTMVGKHAWST